VPAARRAHPEPPLVTNFAVHGHGLCYLQDMSQAPLLAAAPQKAAPDLIAPTEEEWRRMSPWQREQLLSDYNARLSVQAELMAESRPHGRAKSKALDKLSQYFSRVGRRIYLAGELAVLYPGKKAFSPDIMAVLDVDDPGDEDTRSAWVVADEGKGLDLALEVYYSGDRNKDYVDNVAYYAELGISEYFLYDRRAQVLLGYRLPSAGARRYQPIRPRFGRLGSEVLGLDLVVSSAGLRIFHGSAELYDSTELIAQMDRMLEEVQRRHDQAEQERQRAEQERQRAEQERQRALQDMRDALLAILAARGLEVDEGLRQTIAGCQDSAVLGRWLARAAVVGRAGEVVV
jgi:Uma2 family endonuclease